MKIATGLFLSIVALVLILLTACDTTPQGPPTPHVMPVAPCVAKAYTKPAGSPFTILCPNGSIWMLDDNDWLKRSDGPLP